jgi:hypothetical protein
VTLRELELEAKPILDDPWRVGELPPERKGAAAARAEAERRTCSELGAAGSGDPAEAERRTCSAATARRAGREIRIRCFVSEEGLRLWRLSRRLCRAGEGEGLRDWECAERILDHFAEVWAGQAAVQEAAYPILARDGFRCMVPGCRNRRNLHGHHIVPRSQGGSDDAANLVTVCFDHHIHGIHGGVIRCSGTAPDWVVWELGVEAGREPIAVYLGDEVVEGRREEAAAA